MIEKTIFEPVSETPLHAVRSSGTSIARGLRGRCPACGEGRILRSYLKVNDACPSCGEELHHHRADDFPPYVTILVVGHVLGALMFAVDDIWPDLPIAVHYVTWPLLCILLSLWLLPVFKGGLIAYQWALRMHGFETVHAVPVLGEQVPVEKADPGKPIMHRSAA